MTPCTRSHVTGRYNNRTSRTTRCDGYSWTDWLRSRDVPGGVSYYTNLLSEPVILPTCRPLVDRIGADPECFPPAPYAGREPCARDAA